MTTTKLPRGGHGLPRLRALAVAALALSAMRAPATAQVRTTPAAKATAPANAAASLTKPVSPQLPFKLVETAAWRAELPSTWSATHAKRYGAADAQRMTGLWKLKSANGNWKLRVRIRENGGKVDFRKVAEANFARMLARLDGAVVLKKDVLAAKGVARALLLVRGGMRRNERMRPYFAFRMLTYFEGVPVRATITLSASHERMGVFMDVYERFFQSFALKPPPAAPAAATAKNPTRIAAPKKR